MLEELRLNPRASAARTRGRGTGVSAATEPVEVDRELSTGFADRARLRSTGVSGPIHSEWCGVRKEAVG
jgi:hypothetical protein